MSISQLLPHFDEISCVTAGAALQDKWEIDVGKWIARGTWEELDLYFDSLVRHEIWVDQLSRRVTGSTKGILGNKISLVGPGQGNNSNQDRTLFSGELEFRRYISHTRLTRPASPPSQIDIVGHLSINPTRFVHHQAALRRQSSTNSNDGNTTRTIGLDRPPRMFTSRLRHHLSATAADRPLDNEQDNYIHANPRAFLGLTDGNWVRNLQRYWQGTRGLIDHLLTDQQHTLQAPIRFLAEFKINRAETYWEFYHANPVLRVGALRFEAERQYAQSSVTNFEFQNLDTGLRDNSPCVRVHLPNDTTLKLYAKTTNRIRIEVTHNLESSPSFFGPRTSTDENCIADWAERLSIRAANIVNDFLFRCHRQDIVDLNRTSLELLNAISAASDAETKVSELLDILITTSRIVRIANDPRERAIRALEASGVLERLNRRERRAVFSVTPQYLQALGQLRSTLAPNIAPVRQR